MLPVHSQQQRWQAFPLLLPGTTTTQTTLLSMELRLEVQFAEGRRWSWSYYCCRRRHGHRIRTSRQKKTNKRKSANGEEEELSERVCNNNGSSDNSEASKQASSASNTVQQRYSLISSLINPARFEVCYSCLGTASQPTIRLGFRIDRSFVASDEEFQVSSRLTAGSELLGAHLAQGSGFGVEARGRLGSFFGG
jgi:hypothetical protein